MTQPEQGLAAANDEESAGTDRRQLALVGVLAAVVLAAGGYFLLSGDSTDEDLGAGRPTRSINRPVAPAAAPVKVQVLPPASSVKLGRDPFRPLYVVPVAAVAPPVAPPGTTTGGTSTGGTSTGGAGTPAAPAAPVNTTYALRLSRVDGTGSNLTAKFLIGQSGKIQFARAGSVFGRTAEIRLLSIQKGAGGAGTAVIQVGDGSPFDISTGEAAIYVQ